MRQIIAAISRRRRAIDDERRFLVEWQTRLLATYIGATAFSGGSKLIEAASKISLRPQPEETRADRADNPNEPQRGSYERLMMRFGKRIQPPRPPETREDVHEHSGPEAGTSGGS
jgi:hypothetical protein